MIAYWKSPGGELHDDDHPKETSRAAADEQPPAPPMCPLQSPVECELLRANEQLALARDQALAGSRAKDAFLANISHEFRTPLTAIIGYSEMLHDELAEDWAKEDLKRIREAGRHLLFLVNDILDMAKYEADRIVLYPEPFTVEEVCTDAMRIIASEMKRSGNSCVIDLEPDLPQMFTDRIRLRQVLLNLLSNASKFTNNGNVKVAATCDRNEGTVFITVADTGVGISAAGLSQLFTEFTQINEFTSKLHPGTGLGLALSQRLCSLMGGGITVESEPGEGSAFTVNLPLRLKTDLVDPAPTAS